MPATWLRRVYELRSHHAEMGHKKTATQGGLLASPARYGIALIIWT